MWDDTRIGHAGKDMQDLQETGGSSYLLDVAVETEGRVRGRLFFYLDRLFLCLDLLPSTRTVCSKEQKPPL